MGEGVSQIDFSSERQGRKSNSGKTVVPGGVGAYVRIFVFRIRGSPDSGHHCNANIRNPGMGRVPSLGRPCRLRLTIEIGKEHPVLSPLVVSFRGFLLLLVAIPNNYAKRKPRLAYISETRFSLGPTDRKLFSSPSDSIPTSCRFLFRFYSAFEG